MKDSSRIIWSDEAVNNLREIIGYLELKWTEKELKKFGQKLEKQIGIIKGQPLAYPKSRKKSIRRAVMTKQTTIYYQIVRDAIRIVSIFDNRKDPKNLRL